MREEMSLSDFFFLDIIPLLLLLIACFLLGSVVLLFVRLCRYRTRHFEKYTLVCLEPESKYNYERLQEGIEQGIDAIDSAERSEAQPSCRISILIV